MKFIEMFNRASRPIRSRIAAMIGRGILKLVDDAKKMQLLQADFLDQETRDSLEHFQPYGFTYNPLPGGEVLAVFPGGNREHGIVIAVSDRRYRFKPVAPGEVALYTDEGDVIHFKRGQILEIKTKTLKISATTKVEIESPMVDIAGMLSANGVEDTASSTTMAGIKTTFNAHTHAENGSGGGVTNPPVPPL